MAMALIAGEKSRKYLFCLLAAVSLLSGISAPTALLLGFVLANLGWLPQSWDCSGLAKKLLALAIISLGFGTQLQQAILLSSQQLPLILTSIGSTLLCGGLFAKMLKLDVRTGHLIACGTAICGGSAIAAVAPAINAKREQTAIALACVFMLNALALFLFPLIGHLLSLSQQQFGIWCAVAIHDTSSVVGAASAYGEEALQTATTLKLARALWIIPVAALSALLFGGRGRWPVPMFIVGYVAAVVIASVFPQGQWLYQPLFSAGKQLLVLCLFLIGSSITLNQLRTHGSKPLLLAIVLWLFIAVGSLWWLLSQ